MTAKKLLESVTTPSEVERSSPQGWYKQPVIPFIPEAKTASGDRDDFIELVLKVNAESTGTTRDPPNRPSTFLTLLFASKSKQNDPVVMENHHFYPQGLRLEAGSPP